MGVSARFSSALRYHNPSAAACSSAQVAAIALTVRSEKPSIFSALIAEITHGSAQLKKANIGQVHRDLALSSFCRNNLQGPGVIDVPGPEGRETEGGGNDAGGKGS
jgi:hypothetical protein